MKKKTSPVSLLKGVKELLSPRRRWTKEAFARTRDSHKVKWDDDRARKWCLLGALYKVGTGYNDMACRIASKALHQPFDQKYTLTSYNDSFGHKSVLEILDEAIKWLRKRNGSNKR